MITSKKYILTPITKVHKGVTLYRIKALKSFSDVSRGDLGGWVQSEANLSHEGACWIYDEAIVYQDATVIGTSKVSDESSIGGDVVVRNDAHISGSVYLPLQVSWIDS